MRITIEGAGRLATLDRTDPDFDDSTQLTTSYRVPCTFKDLFDANCRCRYEVGLSSGPQTFSHPEGNRAEDPKMA